ncbi:unnamed protein product, partial [Rangifer tarandus platyrhynchus]
ETHFRYSCAISRAFIHCEKPPARISNLPLSLLRECHLGTRGPGLATRQHPQTPSWGAELLGEEPTRTKAATPGTRRGDPGEALGSSASAGRCRGVQRQVTAGALLPAAGTAVEPEHFSRIRVPTAASVWGAHIFSSSHIRDGAHASSAVAPQL